MGDDKRRIFQTFPNSFKYLVDDAEYLCNLAKTPPISDCFQRTQLCRTAILLLVLSLEGLVNRALARFLPADLRDFVMAREDRWSIVDKVEFLIVTCSPSDEFHLDKSSYPWAHLREMVEIRNDLVHPKHDRPAFYVQTGSRKIDNLPFNRIPDGLTFKTPTGLRKPVREKDLVYGQMRITRDPYTLMTEDIDRVSSVLSDIVDWIDLHLGGKLKENDWHTNDEFTLIHPPGATLDGGSQ